MRELYEFVAAQPGGAALLGLFRGVGPAEIEAVAADQGVRLPDEYREFLAVLGADDGGMLRGERVLYPAVLGIKENAREIVAEVDPDFSLDRHVVLLGHEGYIYFFMEEAGGDPAVWGVSEAEPLVLRIADSLGEFLVEHIRDHLPMILARAAKRSGGRPPGSA